MLGTEKVSPAVRKKLLFGEVVNEELKQELSVIETITAREKNVLYCDERKDIDKILIIECGSWEFPKVLKQLPAV